jgi:hypothetical protein
MYTDEMKAQAEESLKEGRTLNDIGNDVVDALFTVHMHMGPGLAEAVYQECLVLEFARREIPIRTQEPINMVSLEINSMLLIWLLKEESSLN